MIFGKVGLVMFDFGKRLKKIREEHNLTQKQLADLIGGTERSIQNYEAGDRKPTFDVILAILDKVDVDANYLLGRVDSPMTKGA